MKTLNKKKDNSCPVCGEILASNLCKNCGYLRLVFPEKMPQSLSKMDKERIAIMKKQFEKQSSSHNDNNEGTNARAYLIFQDVNDSLTVLPLHSEKETSYATSLGKERYLSEGESVIILPIITPEEIAFSINCDDKGIFRIKDLSSNLIINGLPLNSYAKLINGTQILFDTAEFKIHVSIPKSKTN